MGVHGRDDGRFAQRHAQAGGTGYRYEFSWGVGRNPVAGAHISELPLLFPHPVWEHGTEEAGAGVTGPS